MNWQVRIRPFKVLSLLVALLPIFFRVSVLAQTVEEEEDRYKRWLETDVKYIIAPEEKGVFSSLTIDDERDAFIEQFWRRRDPDLSTSLNEYKEEHYRRIAYANERFKSGISGWRTDRGRIYIMFGPSDEIKSHVGGHYRREPYEGGGYTQAFPFEIWRYNYIEGVGSDVEIEFVDPTMTGEFRLALTPEEKDALLYVSGPGGMTWAEQSGVLTRGDRIRNKYTADPNQPMYTRRLKDLPFERLLQLFRISRPPEIRFKDLQKMVTSKVYYRQIPFQSAVHYIRLAEDDLLVPITVKVKDRYLQFTNESGANKATIDLYGIVTSVNGQTAYEFDETVSTYVQDLEELGREQSIYQRKINLKPGLYKLELVVRDRNSEQVGSSQERLSVPKLDSEQLLTSSIFLARRIEPVEDWDRLKDPFVLGLYKVIPKVDRQYWPSQLLKVYFEIYQFQLDSASQKPELSLTYQIRNGQGETVNQIDDTSSLLL
ncbi:GWxTD domain-containing protein, partial [Acidobacteria bacterium AH-259-G07]|nr:GWxTD domain-containing protein [Acidobacteria bacterium AH-259-G07]